MLIPADDLDARCDVLAATWNAWAATLRGLTGVEWALPTRLPGWDVAALVAHHGLFPRGLASLAARPASGPPSVPDAATLLRQFNVPGGPATTKAEGVAAQAQTVARGAKPAELRARFEDEAPQTIATVRLAGPVIDYFSWGSLPLAEAVAVAILEATVHLLDLHAALGVAPKVPEAALTQTAVLLAQVAEPIAFIEAATGRTDHNPFPVIR